MEIDGRREIQRVAFCPHCGNRAPQRLLLDHNYVYVSPGDGEDGSVDDCGLESTYFVAACATCDGILLYHSFGAWTAAEDFPEAGLLFPKGLDLHGSIPAMVRSCYAEAARIKNVAPNAYAVMIRRALEALCDDRGVRKGVLQRRLEELATRGEIPSTLAEMTSVLRSLGNDGAHNSVQAITVSLTWAMDDFFRAVVEYVYVAPSKLASFKERLASTKLEPSG